MALRIEIREREMIKLKLMEKLSIRQIALDLHRSPNTIAREIKLNGGQYGYNHHNAQHRSEKKRKMQGNKSSHYLHLELVEYIDKHYDSQRKSFEVLLN